MSKIDDIKKRHKEAEIHGTDSEAWEQLEIEAYRDIQYLLSKLEIAEKALEKLSVELPGSKNNELVLHRERIAKEALKQLREG